MGLYYQARSTPQGTGTPSGPASWWGRAFFQKWDGRLPDFFCNPGSLRSIRRSRPARQGLGGTAQGFPL